MQTAVTYVLAWALAFFAGVVQVGFSVRTLRAFARRNEWPPLSYTLALVAIPAAVIAFSAYSVWMMSGGATPPLPQDYLFPAIAFVVSVLLSVACWRYLEGAPSSS